jgi:hypothetical protein
MVGLGTGVTCSRMLSGVCVVASSSRAPMHRGLPWGQPKLCVLCYGQMQMERAQAQTRLSDLPANERPP